MTTSILRTALSDLKTKPYTEISNDMSFSRYFDYAGVALSDSNGAYYRCLISVSPHSSASLPAAALNPAELMRVQIKLIWPTASEKNNVVFETSLAHY